MEAHVTCRRCGDPMTLQETVKSPDEGPTIEMFACPRDGCGRKAGVIYEPEGGLSDADQGWVERVIAERGAFFPTDWTGGGGPRFAR